jgi:hypothetical protein
MKARPEDVQEFKDAVHDIYNGCGPDIWGERVPSKSEFVEWISQLLGDGGYADVPMEVSEKWRGVSLRSRREIILAVGP